MRRLQGFTIVELVIVVVVIGILSALVTIGYRGVAGDAKEKAAMSELQNIEGRLAQYKAKNGKYPTSLADAGVESAASLGYVGGGSSFCVSIKNDDVYVHLRDGIYGSGECTVEWFIADGPDSVSIAAYHACAVIRGGKAYCWGINSSSQLGDGTTATSSAPVQIAQGDIPEGVLIKSISVGSYGSCALSEQGKAYCWGANTSGSVGDGTTTRRSAPVSVAQGEVPLGVRFTALAAGNSHTCGLGSNGKAYCWGASGTGGKLGNGSTGTSSTPVAVAPGAIPANVTLKSISVGGESTCALGSDGRAYCWGANSNGQLGNGSTSISLTPTVVARGVMPSGINFAQVSSGGFVSCGLGTDAKAYCWGSNYSGSLGNGTSTQSLAPAAVGGVTPLTLKGVYPGDRHVCALGIDKKVYCWGDNYYGTLADGTTVSKSTPIVAQLGDMAPSGSVPAFMSATTSRTCLVAVDGSLYCWGNNSSGLLGDGTQVNRLVPTLIKPTI